MLVTEQCGHFSDRASSGGKHAGTALASVGMFLNFSQGFIETKNLIRLTHNMSEQVEDAPQTTQETPVDKQDLRLWNPLRDTRSPTEEEFSVSQRSLLVIIDWTLL